VRGETWRIACPTPLQRGQKVRIVARQGLLLEVRPAINHDEKGE